MIILKYSIKIFETLITIPMTSRWETIIESSLPIARVYCQKRGRYRRLLLRDRSKRQVSWSRNPVKTGRSSWHYVAPATYRRKFNCSTAVASIGARHVRTRASVCESKRERKRSAAGESCKSLSYFVAFANRALRMIDNFSLNLCE